MSSGPCLVCSAVLLGVLEAFWALSCVQCGVVRSSEGLLGLVLCCVQCGVVRSSGDLLGHVLCEVRCC